VAAVESARGEGFALFMPVYRQLQAEQSRLEELCSPNCDSVGERAASNSVTLFEYERAIAKCEPTRHRLQMVGCYRLWPETAKGVIGMDGTPHADRER